MEGLESKVLCTEVEGLLKKMQDLSNQKKRKIWQFTKELILKLEDITANSKTGFIFFTCWTIINSKDY